MEKAKEVLLKGLQNISTTNLSQLLFDNKSVIYDNGFINGG